MSIRHRKTSRSSAPELPILNLNPQRQLFPKGIPAGQASGGELLALLVLENIRKYETVLRRTGTTAAMIDGMLSDPPEVIRIMRLHISDMSRSELEAAEKALASLSQAPMSADDAPIVSEAHAAAQAALARIRQVHRLMDALTEDAFGGLRWQYRGH